MLRLISTLLNHISILVMKSNLAHLKLFKLTFVRGNEADFEKSAQVNNKKSNALFIA